MIDLDIFEFDQFNFNYMSTQQFIKSACRLALKRTVRGYVTELEY